MRFIVAVIQPHRLDAVREALAEAGVQGMTVSEVRGLGRQKGHREIYRGAEYEIEYVPKIKLEVAVPADLAQRVIDTIRNAAHWQYWRWQDLRLGARGGPAGTD